MAGGRDIRFTAFLGVLILPLLTGIASAAEEPSFRNKLFEADIDLPRDGLATSILRSEIQVGNAAGASQIGQLPVQYTESMEDLDILEAYTLKANGQKFPVDTAAIFPQLAPGAQLPMLTDRKQKVIVFPNLEVGDTAVFVQRRKQRQTLFPGYFAVERFFPRTVALDEARIAISTPKDMALSIETHDVAFEKSESGDRTVYTWHHSVPNPVATDPAMLSSFERLPRIFVSTMKDYDELARAYASGAAPKMVVTPKIQALADQITAGQSDRRASRNAGHAQSEQRQVEVEIGQR